MQEKSSSSSDMLSAGLIIIGNEILSGRTQDTNTSWIAERLNGRGIRLLEVRIVADIESAIVEAVNHLRHKYDYVFTTGGIGPTHDDITAESIAKAFDRPYERHALAYQILESYYGADQLTDARAKMAIMPRDVTLIPNPVSGAPGFVVENVHVMAGVPRIMQSMMDHVLETLKIGKPLLSNTVACNLAESVLAEDLRDLQKSYPDIEVGSYPHYRGGAQGLCVVLRSTDMEALSVATEKLVTIIQKHGDEPRAMSVRLPEQDIKEEQEV